MLIKDFYKYLVRIFTPATVDYCSSERFINASPCVLQKIPAIFKLRRALRSLLSRDVQITRWSERSEQNIVCLIVASSVCFQLEENTIIVVKISDSRVCFK